jgi:Flp pilus assembly protein CpaB
VATDVRPRSNRLLMVVGIIVSVAAGAVVILLLSNRNIGGSSSDRNTDVVISAVDVPAGTQISDQLIKVVKFAPDQVPLGAETRLKDATGQFAAVALPKGTVLTGSNLVNSLSKLPAQKKPYLDIPSGQVAISIPYGAELQAVSGYIQEGDKIDILYLPNGGAVVKTTFQNLVVQRVGQAASGGTASGGGGGGTSMVVFVALQDAEDLTFLFATGNYKLVLKSQQDITKNDVGNTTGSTSNEFTSRFNVPKG